MACSSSTPRVSSGAQFLVRVRRVVLLIIASARSYRQITVNDLPVGRSVDETIRLIKAFQFVEKYGEVCPANWHEGSKTMKADPKGSLEYFSAVNAPNGTDGARKRARVE